MNKTPTTFSATRHLVIGFLSLAVLLAGFGTWAAITQIAGAIIASGRIEVDQNRQVVQHLDGGIVSRILVNEGDAVSAGDPLILLDESLINSEITILEGQIFELMARRGRLEAERDAAEEISFDVELKSAIESGLDVSDFVDGQTRLFHARKETLDQSVKQLNKRRIQISDQITGIDAQSTALRSQLELIDEELVGQQELLDKGLAQAARVLNLKREKARLLGQVGELTASKAQSEGKITEIDIEIIKLRTTRREEAITTLRDLQYRELEALEERNVQRKRLERLSIRAPVSGIVYGLNVFAEKSVILPADPLLYLVPQDRPLFIAAQIEPIHIEQVHIGQSVVLRFSTFDQKTTPELDGTVSQISADVFTDETTGIGYYRAEIIVNEGEISRLPDDLYLIPGMPVESFLKTDNRTPLTYLVKPFSDYFVKAFRES